MPVAVRNSITFQYLNGGCEWVSDAGSAHNFVDSVAAERFCVERGLKDAQVLILLEDGPAIVLKLDEERFA
jgi:hypothetical protein